MNKPILLSGSPCKGVHWLHLPHYPTNIVINTDNKSVKEIAQELNQYIKR